MTYRITMWATVGFLIAGFWALLSAPASSSSHDLIRQLWTLVCITCPIAIAGMHHPLGLYEVLMANSGTYALAGLVVETLRRQVHHAH